LLDSLLQEIDVEFIRSSSIHNGFHFIKIS